MEYTHNTANDHEGAMEWFEKARNRRLKSVPRETITPTPVF